MPYCEIKKSRNTAKKGGKMANSTSELRNEIFIDVYNGKIPQRIPEKVNVLGPAALEYCGFDLRYSQYGISDYLKALDTINGSFDTDTVIGTWPGSPWLNKVIGSKTRVMGSDGFIQHPDVPAMYENEYDELIADPIKFIWEKAIPRVYTEFDRPYPYNAFALLKAQKLNEYVGSKTRSANAEIAAKYNKVTTRLVGAASGKIPLDYIADFLRSFSGLLIDIRRRPGDVQRALDVITPILLTSQKDRNALPKPNRQLRSGCAPHMPTFMRVKDFERFYWPGFKQAMWQKYEAGYGVNVFCEDDWMHLIDYLQELPPGTELQFEKGDPKILKEKLGSNFIISGLFPSTYLKYASPTDVEIKAKELIDILAPGGNFVFNFDKSVMRNTSVNWDNFSKLLDIIHMYGKY